jgi:hypothetical protein
MDFHIIPECYVDTNLIETLVPPEGDGYNHQMGCPNVAKKMTESKALKDGFALGIIDKDKKEVAYAKSFDLVVNAGQLILLKHPTKNHYFIQIVPAIETWIIEQANEVGLSMATYDLPDGLSDLKYQSKTLKSKKDPRFKRLFKALMKEKASGVVLLSEWVNYLKSHPFDADLDVFKVS